MATLFLVLAIWYIFMAYEMETNQVGLSTITEAFVLLGYLLGYL
jgi:hypothetical protein